MASPVTASLSTPLYVTWSLNDVFLNIVLRKIRFAATTGHHRGKKRIQFPLLNQLGNYVAMYIGKTALQPIMVKVQFSVIQTQEVEYRRMQVMN